MNDKLKLVERTINAEEQARMQAQMDALDAGIASLKAATDRGDYKAAIPPMKQILKSIEPFYKRLNQLLMNATHYELPPDKLNELRKSAAFLATVRDNFSAHVEVDGILKAYKRNPSAYLHKLEQEMFKLKGQKAQKRRLAIYKALSDAEKEGA
jgi:hypothetical protein